jgi:hypothetical protein
MLSIYEAVRGDFRIPNSTEQTEQVLLGVMAGVNDLIDMGAGRYWRVVKTEIYQLETLQVTLAAVVPDGFAVPPESDWVGFYWPDYPARTFALAMAPDGSVITTESDMTGAPMSGIVDVATFSNGQSRLVDTDWVVERVTTFMPTVEPSAYAGIHLCHCAKIATPIAA